MSGAREPHLVVDGVGKSFVVPGERKRIRVLEDILIKAKEGEIVSIVGPSGCGKTTLLNIIAGFEPADEGRVIYRGKTVQGPSPERAVVFQSAVLFPWLTARGNISYGLKRKGENRRSIRRLSEKFIQMAGLEGFDNFYPDQLSGGMQQRVALARVLVLNPRVLLMDEPFASLDAQSRSTMQQLLLELWQELKPTILFVTHDVEEALFLADRTYILSKRPGKIIRERQVSFDRPRSLPLTGTPAFSQLKSEVRELLKQDCFTGSSVTYR